VAQFGRTGGAVWQDWWRSLAGLVAQFGRTGGAVWQDWWRSLGRTGGAVCKGATPLPELLEGLLRARLQILT
jgi:hypothetical protein